MQDDSTIKQFTSLSLERTLGARGALDGIDLVKNAVIETALTDAYAALERAEDHLRRALVLLKEEVA